MSLKPRAVVASGRHCCSPRSPRPTGPACGRCRPRSSRRTGPASRCTAPRGTAPWPYGLASHSSTASGATPSCWNVAATSTDPPPPTAGRACRDVRSMRHHQPHPLHFACAMVGAVPYPDDVEWLLTPGERGNGQTRLDDGHQGRAWSEGNLVRPLIHGATYFAELYQRIEARSEEHTSELQSLMRISYAVFCLTKKITKRNVHHTNTYKV